MVWRFTGFNAFHVWSRFSLPQGLELTNSSCLNLPEHRDVVVALARYPPLGSERGPAPAAEAEGLLQNRERLWQGYRQGCCRLGAISRGWVSARREVPEVQSGSRSQQVDV